MTTMHGHFHQCARESTFAVVPSFYDAGTRSLALEMLHAVADGAEKRGIICSHASVRKGRNGEAPDRCLEPAGVRSTTSGARRDAASRQGARADARLIGNA
jgi:hypothetical protein